MALVYFSLGSNLGDRRGYIRRAIEELGGCGLRVLKVSGIIETEPFESPAQGRYLNAAVKAATDHSPEELHALTRAIEIKLGRTKTAFHGPRTIDIDILLYDDVKLATPRLVIPHPRMLQRGFVMRPLKEIDPGICASLRP